MTTAFQISSLCGGVEGHPRQATGEAESADVRQTAGIKACPHNSFLNLSNTTTLRVAASSATQVSVSLSSICNRQLSSVEVVSCVNRNRRSGRVRTSEQLFFRRLKNFRSSVALYGRSGLTSRSQHSPDTPSARNATPFSSVRASASRTLALPLRSMPRLSGDTA